MTDNLFNTGIRPAIDEYLRKKGEEVRDYGDYWSASSSGYCMRKNIFERLGVPHVEKDSDNRTTRIFEAGHVFHSWIQGITKDAGLSIASEVELIDEDMMIKGHFDDLVLIEGWKDYAGTGSTGTKIPDNHLILYDYKTAHSKWFEYVKGRPMSHYNRMQLGTYMYMLRKQVLELRAEEKRLMGGKEPSEDVDALESLGWRIGSLPSKELVSESRILKISKDDLRLHEIQLLWTESLEKDVVGYWSTLNGYWKNKKLPNCTCADYEKNKKTGIGFMADPKYNPFYYNGEPCSLEWFAKEGVDSWS